MKKLLSIVAVVAVVAITASSAFAGSPLRSVGVEAGYVSADLGGIENNSTWVAGVFADFGLPATNLYVNPFVNYWNWSQSENSVDTSFRDVSVGANMKWTIPTSAVRFQPFLAAGVSVHMLNASAEDAGVSLFDQGDTKFGFQGGAGFKMGVSQSANIIGSGWYNNVENADNWSVRGGLAWNI
jgi:opacity protein-like surface antigen